MNKLGKDFVETFRNKPVAESSTVRGVVQSGGAGGLVVMVGGADVVVTQAIGAGFALDITQGRVPPGSRVELSRVGGVYAVRGIVTEF